MSLFVCMSCGCIDDDDLVTKDLFSLKGRPNLTKVEMYGYSKDCMEERGEINYICSECNTGIWHGEFEKVQANAVEKVIAMYSEVNAITPLDHTIEAITPLDHTIELVKDESMRFGYRLPTTEELEAKSERKREADIKKAKLLPILSAMDTSGDLTRSFSNLFKEDNKKEEQSEYTKKLFLERAEFKRLYKKLKKKENKTKEDLERLEILNLKRRECTHRINENYGKHAGLM